MRYGSAYLKETNQRIRASGEKPCPACGGSGKLTQDGKPSDCPACSGKGNVPFNWMDLWEVEIDGGVNDVNVEEACRALDESAQWGGMPWERKIAITKMSVVGKKVFIFYGGVQIGAGFILTKVDQSFDLFPELKENNPALTRLIDVCVSALLGKSVPPQIGGQAPAAGMQRPGASSAR